MSDIARPPLSERLCAGLCVGFALWTLCVHAVGLAGGALSHLVVAFAITAGALGAGIWKAGLATDWTGAANSAEPAAPRAKEVVAIALAALAAGAALATDAPIARWALWLFALGLAAGTVKRRPLPAEATPAGNGRSEAALWGLGIACAVYALAVHRPDADDAFYVNLAVAAIDHPELPLLARDTLHGRFDLPIHYATYRLHGFELANAAVAWITGLPAIRVFHVVTAAAAALCVPLAHAALLRRLLPQHWWLATLAVVVVLAAPGETHRWYGNFAFVRMWQGKGVFLFVFLPLVQLAALRFAQRPDGPRFAMLAATQIAALGCTSTALWAAPVASLVAMSAALPLRLASARTLAIGALASGYLIAAGLLLKSGVAASIPELAESFDPGVQLAGAFTTAFGEHRLYAFALVSLFLAWAATPPDGLARRFAIAAPLATGLVLFNPFLDAFVRANVTGPSYWRAVWALPAPLLMAFVLVAPLRFADRLGPRPARALAGLAIAVFAIAVPRFHGFAAENAAWLDAPGLKVGAMHRWAVAVNEIAPRKRVVAPPPVATWIPTAHDHAYPMAVRVYLKPLREKIGELAFRDRYVMTQFVDGNAGFHPREAQIFERGLDLYDVQAVCIRIGQTIAPAREILRRAGFTKRLQGTHMEIWARP